MRGEAVRDLQRRLRAAGFLATPDTDAGAFGPSTIDAVRRFQSARGLHGTGECDAATWATLVEAGFSLGDRLLVHRSPNLRGDDIVELQELLGRLGFDCGRPDGIFGPLADAAVREFQDSLGLVVDGVVGRSTVDMLRRVTRQSGDGPGVASVREHERHHEKRGLSGTRVMIGQFGGLSTLSRLVTRQLRAMGAHVVVGDQPDPHIQATMANTFSAAAFVGFEAATVPTCEISYFAVPDFESVGGRALAGRLFTRLGGFGLAAAPKMVGMRLPVLRETRMPAVLCTLGPVREVVERAADISDNVVAAIDEWATPT